MEGHGVWRSTPWACEAGVHYSRGDLLCICTEDGTWPNPVCRDTFRVLHNVEVIQNFQLSKTQRCSPTKLYLAGCNVCFCPSTGNIDPSLCTQKECTENKLISTKYKEKDVDEVYGQCDMDKKYKLGCKSCVCLRNNRLLCDKCTKESQCTDRIPGEKFNLDCNVCHCDDKGTIYCTLNTCLDSKEINLLKNSKPMLLSTRAPVDDIDCDPGRKYMKNCNTCYCFQPRGPIKKYGCTVNECPGEDLPNNCEVGETFRKPCQVCHCAIYNNKKLEVCSTDPKCVKVNIYMKSPGKFRHREIQQDCEPLQVYKNGCNTCQCHPDGKTLLCTDKHCEAKPISLDIIRIAHKIPDCPRGHSYKIDCNFCYCLSNGDALCTTVDCKTKNTLF